MKNGFDPVEEYNKRHSDYINCVTRVNAKKLLESVYMDNYEPWGLNSFTVSEVKNAILSTPNLVECDDSHYEYENGRDPRHIERVLYFTRHPEKIDHIRVGIAVYPKVNPDDFLHVVDDGWHRLYAAIILGIKIPCFFEGGKLFLDSIKE